MDTRPAEPPRSNDRIIDQTLGDDAEHPMRELFERWGLPEQARQDARRHVDAYLWFGRPWLYRQNQPFVMERALGLVRSSPY